jgi:DNA-binding NarL/FixJ family response regulator
VVLNQNSVSSPRLARQLHADACIAETSLQERTGVLIEALKAVQGGKTFMDPRLQKPNPSGHLAHGQPLSERQHEILRCVAEGLSNRDIGVRLNITPNTVRDHLSEVMRRLEVSNRASAVSSAFRLGLLP